MDFNFYCSMHLNNYVSLINQLIKLKITIEVISFLFLFINLILFELEFLFVLIVVFSTCNRYKIITININIISDYYIKF